MNDIIKNAVIRSLKDTNREGVRGLIWRMERDGFFEAPCSGKYHLAKEGGLAEHSLNVMRIALILRTHLSPDTPRDSVVICALLHDLGKMGQFGKQSYIQNMIKDGRPTKDEPEQKYKQSEQMPYITNPELLTVDHSVRSVVIASKYITLTEEEQQAILWHDGLYGTFKYEIPGKETPLYMLLHFADMWASRVTEV